MVRTSERANDVATDPQHWESVVTKLVEERGPSLHRFARFVSGSSEDAADLVQDALVKTFGRLSGGHSVSSAEAYVRRVIVNSFLDNGRRRTRWNRIAHLLSPSETQESSALATEHRLDLQAELLQLTPRERACIVLRYYEDLKVNDIAETLDISAGAVKRYLSDALVKLRTHILEDPPAPSGNPNPRGAQHARSR